MVRSFAAAVVGVLLAALAVLVPGPAAAAPSPDHLAAATRGFVFGYSPVAMARTRALTLCGTGGTNAFLDLPVTANPLFRAVVAPNRNPLLHRVSRPA